MSWSTRVACLDLESPHFAYCLADQLQPLGEWFPGVQLLHPHPWPGFRIQGLRCGQRWLQDADFRKFVWPALMSWPFFRFCNATRTRKRGCVAEAFWNFLPQVTSVLVVGSTLSFATLLTFEVRIHIFKNPLASCCVYA